MTALGAALVTSGVIRAGSLAAIMSVAVGSETAAHGLAAGFGAGLVRTSLAGVTASISIALAGLFDKFFDVTRVVSALVAPIVTILLAALGVVIELATAAAQRTIGVALVSLGVALRFGYALALMAHVVASMTALAAGEGRGWRAYEYEASDCQYC